MLADLIFPVVVAVGCAHYRVDVVLGMQIVVESDDTVVVEFDEAMDPVIENVVIVGAADPIDVPLGCFLTSSIFTPEYSGRIRPM